MTHLLLIAASIGSLGSTSDNLRQEFECIKSRTVGIAVVSRAAHRLTPAERQRAMATAPRTELVQPAAKTPQPAASTPSTGVLIPGLRQDIPPATPELVGTASLYPPIGLVLFFCLGVFAVLRAAVRSPKW